MIDILPWILLAIWLASSLPVIWIIAFDCWTPWESRYEKQRRSDIDLRRQRVLEDQEDEERRYRDQWLEERGTP